MSHSACFLIPHYTPSTTWWLYLEFLPIKFRGILSNINKLHYFGFKRIRRKILTPVHIGRHLHTLIVTGSITKIFMVFEAQSLNQTDIEPWVCFILCHSVKSQCLNSLYWLHLGSLEVICDRLKAICDLEDFQQKPSSSRFREKPC